MGTQGQTDRGHRTWMHRHSYGDTDMGMWGTRTQGQEHRWTQDMDTWLETWGQGYRDRGTQIWGHGTQGHMDRDTGTQTHGDIATQTRGHGHKDTGRWRQGQRRGHWPRGHMGHGDRDTDTAAQGPGDTGTWKWGHEGSCGPVSSSQAGCGARGAAPACREAWPGSVSS